MLIFRGVPDFIQSRGVPKPIVSIFCGHVRHEMPWNSSSRILGLSNENKLVDFHGILDMMIFTHNVQTQSRTHVIETLETKLHLTNDISITLHFYQRILPCHVLRRHHWIMIDLLKWCWQGPSLNPTDFNNSSAFLHGFVAPPKVSLSLIQRVTTFNWLRLQQIRDRILPHEIRDARPVVILQNFQGCQVAVEWLSGMEKQKHANKQLVQSVSW